MLEIVDNADRLEILSPMAGGRRLLFVLLGLIPLLAPYELLLRIEWQNYLHPFFLFAVIVSAGAVAVSAFLFFAALAGLDSRMTLDAARLTFTYSAVAPVIRQRTRVYPLSSLGEVDIRTHEWSDGAPSYSLTIITSDGAAFESASSWSREEVERGKARVEAFLKRGAGARPPS